ncbi:MAG TPA: FCD domain-containing protein [Streptosporangiaceae bacterium]|jgi:DNA-binding FadR family transcriptional regulator|nr:FCD domain-containing protein [Streptosporangiaceae bacterium]
MDATTAVSVEGDGRLGITSHAERGQRLAELILRRSRDAGLAAGGRLPTERQLSIDLGVTRSAVRHAMAILEAQGQISREVGRGTFLRGAPAAAGARPAGSRSDGSRSDGARSNQEFPLPWTLAPAGADFAPADVMTIRRLLEPPAMSLVVSWATAADLEEMQRCLAGGDQAATFEEFESWDLALHRCIMAASHSPLLVALYQGIEQARHGQVWGDLKRRSASQERRAEYQQDHRAIVDALRARDSGRAVEAMRLHLARVQGHLNVTDPAAGVSWG